MGYVFTGRSDDDYRLKFVNEKPKYYFLRRHIPAKSWNF